MTEQAPADEAKPKKAKKPKAEAKVPPTIAAASAAWIRDNHHPRLSEEESCALMRRVFPGSRHHCRAEECPRACPRHPDFAEPPPPPAYTVAPPPMTPEEAAAAELGLASVRGLPARGLFRPSRPQAVEPVVPETETGPIRPVVELALRLAVPVPEEQALWDEAMATWEAENASAPQSEALVDGPADGGPSVAGDTIAPIAAAPVPARSSRLGGPGDNAGTKPEPEPWKNGLPPCTGCGKHRPIMLAMRPPFEGEKGYRICVPCYLGARPASG